MPSLRKPNPFGALFLIVGNVSPVAVANLWNISTINNSRNATGVINMTLTNNHIICRNVTVTVNDGLLTDSQVGNLRPYLQEQ